MPTIDTADFFNKNAYSDITISFGDRQFKAHKFILCSQSDYFKKLCGPNTGFAEGNQKVVELKDDDPDAVEAMLKWIYTFDYDTTSTSRRGPKEHIEVYMVADKYLLPALQASALLRLKAALQSIGTVGLANALCMVHRGDYGSTITEVLNGKRDEQLSELIKCDIFRGLVAEKQDLLLEPMDKQAQLWPELLRCEGFRTLLATRPDLCLKVMDKQVHFWSKHVRREARYCASAGSHVFIKEAVGWHCCQSVMCGARTWTTKECWVVP